MSIGHKKGEIPDQTIQHPHQPQDPSYRGITPERIPVQNKIRREHRSIHQCREEDERRRRHIVAQLEEDYLADDFQRWKVGSGSRWRETPARHELCVCVRIAGIIVFFPGFSRSKG